MNNENEILFHGMPILNRVAYFIEDGMYVEEFDTPDGQHWIGTWDTDEYTPDILRKKIQADLDGIPYI